MVYTPASVHQTVSQFEKAVQLYSARPQSHTISAQLPHPFLQSSKVLSFPIF